MIAKLRIAGENRHEWFVLRVNCDLEIRFGVFDFRERAVFGSDRVCIGVVQIVDRFQAGVAFDAIFDSIVETRGNVFNRLLAHSAAELNKHLGPAGWTRFVKRDVCHGHRAFFVCGRHDPHLRFPLFLPAVELARESGDKNKDECECKMDEEVIAVHGWYLKFCNSFP